MERVFGTWISRVGGIDPVRVQWLILSQRAAGWYWRGCVVKAYPEAKRRANRHARREAAGLTDGAQPHGAGDGGMMYDLSGKAALITGASGGIGGAIAAALCAAGAQVGLSGTRVAPLEALAADLGDAAHVLPCNLSDREAVAALPKTAIAAMGSVDILINNAGITRDNLFMRMSDAEWDSVVEVNLTASMALMRGVLRPMMKARWGRIISIGSVVGSAGNPGQGNYAAAKAGLIGMSKSLAYEVASRGITVNVIAPGYIETAMTENLNDEQKAAILSQVPAGRIGQAGEIAAAARYLASDEAGYVTGATLHVNGGMAMY